jgi:SPX domain protein involved in polyphosphate accumulation
LGLAAQLRETCILLIPMKFAKYLRDQAHHEWRFYYIDYEGLKKALKERSDSNQFSEAEEALFVESLEHEIQKVRNFSQCA